MLKPKVGEPFCMDYLDLFSHLRDETIDLIIADPPYGAKGRAKWDQFMGTGWLQEAARVLKPTGSLYTFMGYSHAPETALALRKLLIERAWITWWKRNSALSQVNNWKSQAEFIFYFVKGKGFTWNRWDILEPFDTKGGAKDSPYEGKVPGNVWRIPGVNWCSKERTAHPTQKPLKVIERIILASSNKGDLILDPFGGSFTTAVAAENLGRRWISCDINPEYVELGKERLSQIRGVI